jgi:DNA processing protein
MVEPSLSFREGAAATVRVRDEYAPWLALGRVKGLGGVGFKKLAASFADPTKAFYASAAELEQVEGLHRDVIDGIANFSSWVEIDDELSRVRAAGIDIVRFTSPDYPARLRMIADPPPFLYIKGALAPQDERTVAIVG